MAIAIISDRNWETNSSLSNWSEYLFCQNIFFPEKNIQLKQPLFYCGFKLPCERIVFDFHDDTRLFHIVYLGIY
jgi:hypothetical protein